MIPLGFAALLILFSFVVETLLVSMVTKLLMFENASVPKAAWAVLSSYACTLLLLLPVGFLLTTEDDLFDIVALVLSLVATTIVIRSLYRASWVRAAVAAGLTAVSWGIITLGLSLVEASMR